MLAETRREVARKALHMAMGLFGLCLRWLAPWQAALCALAALAHNLWLFPHYGMKRLERPEEKALGYSGMIGYPAVVLLLIVLGWAPMAVLRAWRGEADLRSGLALAAGAWAVLAFGDAAAALAGMALGGPNLPWNPRKTWTGWLGFVTVGAGCAAVWSTFVARAAFTGPEWCATLAVSLVAALVAGLVETLPGQIDDNLTVPLAAWLVFAFADGEGIAHLKGALAALASDGAIAAALLAVNLLLALAAYLLRWVGPASCALGILFGSLVLVGTGALGYGFLLLFYLVSQLSTFYGGRIKARRGIAEPDSGRRGVGSVFSKGFVPAIFALVSPLAFVAALAVYAADTVASEVGKASGGQARLLFRRRPVPQGTVGAVSRAGSLAGLIVLTLFGALSFLAGAYWNPAFFLADDLRVFAGGGTFATVGALDMAFLSFCLLAAAAVAFFAESLLNERVVAKGRLSKELGHLATGGLAGALTFGVASSLNFILALAQ